MTMEQSCENCGSEISQEASFCLSCGASVKPGKQSKSTAEIKCKSCGEVSPEGSLFCGDCGNNLNENQTGEPKSDSDELPMVEFSEAIGKAFVNYVKFSGRATRAEYWWFVLLTQIIGFISVIPIAGWLISLVGWIVVFIPSISISVRRLHDIGRSGWWLLVWVMTTLPWIIWIVGFITAIGTFEESGKDDIWPILTPWLIWAGILTLVNVGVCIWWVVWFVKKGDKGPNRFGPDPRQKRQPE